MSTDPTNPYAPGTGAGITSISGEFDPDVEKKIEAIIKDAGQFWVAIVLCFLCSGIGILVIGPWYLVRLVQWNSLNNQYPSLKDPHAPPGSLARRFQSSHWKLIAGIVAGVLLFLAFVLFFFFATFTAVSTAPQPVVTPIP